MTSRYSPRPLPSTVDDLFQFIDRELWVITSADGERRGGLVATWVQSSSLDPNEPIVTISISQNHFTRELIDVSGVFGLHLLGEDQRDVALNFCRDSGRDRDKLAGMAWQYGTIGCPVVSDCLASAECRVIDRYEAAGRVLYFADISTAHTKFEGHPLKERAFVESISPDQRASLNADREADLAVMQHAIAAWRNSL